LYARGARAVIGHSVAGLLSRLTHAHPELEALRDLAAELDLFYIPTRYPSGLVAGVPYQAFTRAQADRALAAGASLLAAIERALPPVETG
jgi:HEPN domain-containing protein